MSSLEKFTCHNKGDTPLVCLTAYTYPMAHILAPHVDLILVGDSLGNVIYGMESTQDVTLDMMIAHGKAVVKGADKQCVVVVDMPYGTYEDSDAQALETAQRLIEETGADAVKLEGGAWMAPRIHTLHDHNIPVMGHIGLLPQTAAEQGGFKIKGKTEEEINHLTEDARIVGDAGAFAIVIEGLIEEAAVKVTGQASVPTIGIGASASCSGQILVTDDMLGVTPGKVPKFVKNYADIGDGIAKAVQTYAEEVKSGAFPDHDHTYHKKIT